MGLRGHPTLDVLAVLLAVFCLQFVLGLGGGRGSLALAWPLLDRPWTILTSVYAHDNLGHLLANVVALVVFGPLVAYRTSRRAFHGFFLATGALSGVSEVVFGSLLVGPTAVWGASGAIFALLGYLLAGNVVSTVVLDRISLSARGQLLVFGVLAVLITLATARSGVALFGHATGLLCGLLAGRWRLIDTPSRTTDARTHERDPGRF